VGVRRRVLTAVLAVIVLAAVVSGIALAHVIESWEWADDPSTGQPRRNLRIFCGAGTNEQWQAWLREAIANWEGEDTGWTFEIVDEQADADVTLTVGEIAKPNVLGQYAPRFCPGCGRMVGGTLTMDSEWPWGTSGDANYDPVKILKHELGHAMCLDHSAAGNVMPPEFGAGDHNATPNADDHQEATDSAARGAREATPPEPQPDGRQRATVGDCSLTVDPTGLDISLAYLTLVPLGGPLLPLPLEVPDGFERVIAAAGVFPIDVAFAHPADLALKLDPAVISGLGLTGDLHAHPLPPVDPAGVVAVRYVEDADVAGGGRWVEAPVGCAVDLVGGTVVLSIIQGGLYGVAAPAVEQEQAAYQQPFSDLPAGAVGSSLVELRALGVYIGYPDGTAGPDRNLTRLEFFTIAVRLAGGEAEAKKLEDQRPDFADDIPIWGWGYANAAVALDLVRGYPDHTFRPQNNVNGNEATAVLLRLLGGNEDALASEKPWPEGYRETAAGLKMLEGLRALLGGDLSNWWGSAVSRGEMAVLTCDAAWAELRHDAAGAVVPAPSFLEGQGWWRRAVTVATMTADGRRWVLRNVVSLPGEEFVVRVDVAEVVYRGADRPAAGPAGGAALTAMGCGRTVRAVY